MPKTSSVLVERENRLSWRHDSAYLLCADHADFAIQVEEPLEAENAALRQQLIVLRRKVKSRPRLRNADRWFFVQLYRWFLSLLDVLTIIRPETLVRWLRAGLALEITAPRGRPQVQSELRALIRQMSVENPLWGAPRIHGAPRT